jgi:hypothetical protein
MATYAYMSGRLPSRQFQMTTNSNLFNRYSYKNRGAFRTAYKENNKVPQFLFLFSVDFCQVDVLRNSIAPPYVIATRSLDADFFANRFVGGINKIRCPIVRSDPCIH